MADTKSGRERKGARKEAQLLETQIERELDLDLRMDEEEWNALFPAEEELTLGG